MAAIRFVWMVLLSFHFFLINFKRFPKQKKRGRGSVVFISQQKLSSRNTEILTHLKIMNVWVIFCKFIYVWVFVLSQPFRDARYIMMDKLENSGIQKCSNGIVHSQVLDFRIKIQQDRCFVCDGKLLSTKHTFSKKKRNNSLPVVRMECIS